MADEMRITTEELKRRMNAGEKFTIIDVRNPKAWAEGRSKAHGALRIPLDDLDQHVKEIPKDRAVVAYCT